MIQLDPESRCSAESYLQNNAGFVFPCYFSPFLHKFYSLLNPLSCNARVLACETSFQEILRQMLGNRAVEDAISETETSNNDTRHLSGYGKQGPAGADKSLNGRKEAKKVNTRDHFDLLYDMSTLLRDVKHNNGNLSMETMQDSIVKTIDSQNQKHCGLQSPDGSFCMHMRSGGKENSMPYQVISRAMEIVIKEHNLDIETLMSSRLPMAAGTQVGETASQQLAGSSQRVED
ncbi:hypothetical protein OROGR_028777 [Orobanche gracilis]